MATIIDVAKRASVSLKTVSRVINGEGHVSDATRSAVMAAIEALGYVPSNAARSMRSQRSRLIGIITGAISHAQPTGSVGLPDIFVVKGAQAELERQGIIPLIADTGSDPTRTARIFRTLLEHRVDGIIYVAEYHQKVTLPVLIADTPLVLANCFDDAGHHAIVPDDEAGERALVEGLIVRGHRRIAMLTLPASVVAQPLRLSGYRAALAGAGIAFDPALVAVATGTDREREFSQLPSALAQVLALPEPPTALCCANDKMAMRVYALLAERGISIPGGISVVGFDDYRVICEQLQPSLSSASLAYEMIGAKAAEVILKMPRNNPPQGVVDRLIGPVVWRESVRALN
ncbi:transcriptional regulator, LacI family [Devosia lucknowensis]|uniref:Transcriptional regulator, LacI family n=1 Tax=Devosia lucknowensis TaxID=1096929 RepID=A0A1Y6G7Y5_9HYPH|nr:LacI family DNA-binding transcriptional regulator [Devosia lucknowensis]SMQ85864.1 transcriptional regulator, LacI family [Devosia lucknowensis]